MNPKDDRLKMLRATQTDLEPILFLYDDVDMELMKIIGSADKENESDFVDENGTRHILKRFESPEITTFFKQKKLVIADGHHRYESALAYGKEMGFTGGTRYVMAVLVNRYDPGLVVIASHTVPGSMGFNKNAYRASPSSTFLMASEALLVYVIGFPSDNLAIWGTINMFSNEALSFSTLVNEASKFSLGVREK